MSSTHRTATTMAMSTSGGAPVRVETAEVDALARVLRGELIMSGHPDYDAARRVWNGAIDKHPALISRCAGTADVQAAIRFARRHDLRMTVRGGGHNVAGTAVCDGGLVVDLSSMRGIWVDPAARTVRAQGGATIGDVDREAQLFGLAVPLGVVSETGIAGLTLGGGYGWLRRKFGLTCDNLISAEVVAANGQVVTASETDNPELLWALRGGGGGLGVVTSFELRAHPVGPEVYFAFLIHRGDERATLQAFRDWSITAPDEISALAILWHAPAIDDIPVEHHGEPVTVFVAMHCGPPAEGESALAPLRALGRPIADLSGPSPYLDVQRFFDADYPKWEKRYYWTSTYLHGLDDELLDELLAANHAAPSPESTIDLWQLGGAAGRIVADATGFGDRSAPFMLGIEANWEHPDDDGANLQWARRILDRTRHWSTGGRYHNFPGLYEEQDAARAASGADLDRLARTHVTYDPVGQFMSGSR